MFWIRGSRFLWGSKCHDVIWRVSDLENVREFLRSASLAVVNKCRVWDSGV